MSDEPVALPSTTTPTAPSHASQRPHVKLSPSIPAHQNAVASSSKVLLESQVPATVSSLPGSSAKAGAALPLETRVKQSPPLLVNRVDVLGRATNKGEAHPSITRESQSKLSALKLQTDSSSRRQSPPPDPKSLIYVSSGPASNPLNIRPSSSLTRSAQKATPTAPKAIAQPTAKKRVVVGAGWPFVRAVNGVASAGSISLSTPSNGTNAVPPTSASQPEPSNIVSYPSPSPPPPSSDPPPPPSQPPPVHNPTKWKRIDNEIAIAMSPIDDMEDMDFSPEGSPVVSLSHPLPQVNGSSSSNPSKPKPVANSSTSKCCFILLLYNPLLVV